MKTVWCIAYINPEQIKNIERDLRKFQEYKHIEHCIPTVKVLKKTFKNKQSFEEIPLLFNYGFLKIPRKLTKNPKFFTDLRKQVPAITGWVLDPSKALKNKTVLGSEDKLSLDNLATATDQEISDLITFSNVQSIYSADDLDKLEIGSVINLIGYPFEGMEAKVLAIDHNKKQIKVRILISEAIKETIVSFDNVFYTIYRSGTYEDGAMKEKYSEELGISRKRTDYSYDIDYEL